MKKTLLFVAALFAASSLFAQEDMEDVTPKGYDYANASVGLVNIPVGFDTANPPAPYDDLIENYYTNGLFITVGGQMISGATYIDSIRPGVSIVDLGGEVGKVLCVSGHKSGANDKFKELYDVDMNIPQCAGALNWFNFSWFTDPNNTPTDGSETAPNIRCRIVMNAYSNTPLDAENIINKVYCMNKRGNVVATSDEFNAERSNVTSAEFIEFDEDGEPVLDEDENYTYDPTRWLVYEFDFFCQPKDPKDGLYSHPVRLKMEMNNGNLNHATLFIKEVKFFKLNSNPDPILMTRSHTYKTLKPGPTSTGILEALKDNGSTKIYNVTGAYVGNSTEGLSRGVYVAKTGNKSRKVLVK